MKADTVTVSVEPFAQVSALLPYSRLTGFNVGPDHTIFVLGVSEGSPLLRYRVVELNAAGQTLNLSTLSGPEGIYHAQPLGDDLLLVKSRIGDFGSETWGRTGLFTRSVANFFARCCLAMASRQYRRRNTTSSGQVTLTKASSAVG